MELDTSIHDDAWRGVKPKVEVVMCQFRKRASPKPAPIGRPQALVASGPAGQPGLW
ncbi:hypothetical protein [Nonomuraea sp. NPDC049784]|uniref:hypothetical protein n=1 Tax=Nonomuraea sp. NPDC049784 TaxID=3154361 RepID=UPI0033E3BA17